MITRRGMLAMPLAAAAAAAARRPNIVYVLIDDVRWDELGCTGHPFAITPNCDRLAKEGANFVNSFMTTPLCSPSRASILTGQYAHTTGIIDNTDRSAHSHQLVTWPRLLHDAGYDTAFLGKWHMGNDPSPRPGFNYWMAMPGQGATIDPPFNVNGKPEKVPGYVTDILTDRAIEFMERPRTAPFCVYLAHKAIHPNVTQHDDGSVSKLSDEGDFIPAEKYRKAYAGSVMPRRRNYGVPPADKPALARDMPGMPPLGPKTVPSDELILNRMRMMRSVDDGLGRMLASLERTKQLDNTLVVLTSDNGYFYGEHGLANERRLAYEESIRSPLLVRYPARFKPRSRPRQMVLSIDIAPTALELAGVKPPPGLHGRSLLAAGERDAILVEYFSEKVFPRIRNMGYYCARTPQWKYIEYQELKDAAELYNLRNDPYELHNVIAAREAQPALAEIRARLRQLLDSTHADHERITANGRRR